jgi:prepilin-type processing-associated H-X9-DG protein
MRAWYCVAGLAVLVASALLLSGRADEKKAEAKLPADLARVPGDTALLVSVRAADLWGSELGKGARPGLGELEKQMVQGLTGLVGQGPDGLERVNLLLLDLRTEPVLLARTTKPVDKKALLARVVPGGTAEKYAGQEIVANDRQAVAILGAREVVAGRKGEVQSLLDSKPGNGTGALAEAVAQAAKGHSVVIGVNGAKLPPEEEFGPDKLGPFVALLKMKEATLAADLGARSTGRLRIRFGSAEDAKAGEKALEAGRKLGLGALADLTKVVAKDKSPEAAGLKVVLGPLQEAVKAGKLVRKDGDLSATVELKLEPETIGKVAGAVALKMREAARRTQSQNNLKQLALALHNYSDTYGGTLPPHAIYNADGKALLSWRVQVLPFLAQDELYKEFKLDEPWDSKHNKKLLARMPATFKAPTEGKAEPPGQTHYLALVGKGAAFEGKKGLRFPADFTDGTSNTIWIVEAPRGVPWTKPDDLSYDPAKAPPRMGGLFPQGFNAAFADGSVRFLSSKLKEKTLHAYITRNGGEVIGE